MSEQIEQIAEDVQRLEKALEVLRADLTDLEHVRVRLGDFSTVLYELRHRVMALSQQPSTAADAPQENQMKIEDVAPYLSGVGFTLTSIDANDTGADDLAGQFLQYGGEAVVAVSAGADLPPLPDTLAGLIVGHLSGGARAALMIAGTFITIAQVQVMASKPKLSNVLRYISQGISAILAGRAIPTPAV